MYAIRDDVRFAVRRLRLRPGFTAVAVATLALGLGANTAIFTLIDAVMRRPLPVARPAELFRLGNTDDCCVNGGLPAEFSLFSYPLFLHLREQLPELRDLAAFQANVTPRSLRPPTDTPAVTTPTVYVSGNYFRMLGVTPAAGRLLDPSDDRPGAPLVMVMSYRTWTEQFAADPSLIGRAFIISGTPVTLAGVAPRGFFGETMRPNPAGVWLPLGQEPLLRGGSPSILARPDLHWLYAIGRVPGGAPGSSLDARATHALQTWLAGQTFLTANERTKIAQQHIVVTSAASGIQWLRRSFAQPLLLLFAMSGAVLLIAAANLANLLLARADRAQAAICSALGASAGRLMRQSLVEGVALALAGCAGALLVSAAVTRAIVSLAFPADTVIPMTFAPAPPILLFSIALALATGVLFAAAPAWAMGRINPIEALRGMAREGADVAFMPRRTLVVTQVTLSLVLLAGAGLLSKSLARLQNQPLGFEADHRLVVRIDPPALSDQPERMAAVYASMQERLSRLPGVLAVSYSIYSPMEGNNWAGPIAIAGRPVDPERPDFSSWNRVGPGYFETMGTRALRGRTITAADTASAPPVAVVNEAFARTYLADRDPFTVRVGIGDASHANDYAIVGIVENVKYMRPNEPARPMLFVPMLQSMQPGAGAIRMIEMHVAAGSGSLEPAIRRALADVHPDLTALRIVPMETQVADNFTTNRLLAMLASAYGLLALMLAALGLYGVTAYGVARRLHEIGVRLALGAERRQIVWSVLRGALLQTVIGLSIGIPIALAAGGALTAYLFDVDGRDPLVLAAAAFTLLVTTAAASVLPARRAASVEPTRALRAQ